MKRIIYCFIIGMMAFTLAIGTVPANAETANIVLQEIVFVFSELAKRNDVSDTELVKALKNSFDDYEKLHEKLAGCWNDEYGKYEEYGKFKVGDLLTYQEIAKDNENYVENALPKNVRDIYAI